MEFVKIILLILLIACAICVNLTGNLLRAVVIFMSYSSIMCVVWVLLESPDLAITEAAVGAGISGILFLMTLKKINEIKAGDPILEVYDDDVSFIAAESAAAEGAEPAAMAETESAVTAAKDPTRTDGAPVPSTKAARMEKVEQGGKLS